LVSSYIPDPELARFIGTGSPPVYIGFGSIVVEDPNALTKLVFEAVHQAGIRALVSKGWGGLGADDMNIPKGIFVLENVPHAWLFQHVSCVVHHGGAGTTAAGIAAGRPTVVVPFFGDQPFWGAMVSRTRAGPPPIPYKQLTAEKLAKAIAEALKSETLEKARELGAKIKEENGCEEGGKFFHDFLDVETLRCSLIPNRVAAWQTVRTKTRLSALAAAVLADQGLINFSDLILYRPREYNTEDEPWDPISGGASAIVGTIASFASGVIAFPIRMFYAAKHKHCLSKSDVKEAVIQESSSYPRIQNLKTAPNPSSSSFGMGLETKKKRISGRQLKCCSTLPQPKKQLCDGINLHMRALINCLKVLGQRQPHQLLR
jgi:hypothetical protein